METRLSTVVVQKQEALEKMVLDLHARLGELEKQYLVAVERANTDDLTRLLRRGVFMEKLAALSLDAKRDGDDVQLLMIDIDHFKKVNDTYGHQTGDEVLVRVSELVQKFLRPCDIAGRFGGEEIIVALRGSQTEALWIAEGLRCEVERHSMISVESKVDFNVTFSAGLASARKAEFEATTLIALADAALYEAKESGRNQIKQARTGCVSTLEIAKAA